MKIVFFGTPSLGAVVLKKLIDSDNEVVAVVTQPDKVSGRGKEVKFSPVKQVAVEAKIPVLQPEKVSDEAFLDELENIGADIFAVAAYAQKLPNRLLEMAPFGCINVHPSLLPKYRGAAPLMAAILYGDEVAGVSIMRMAEKMDTGNVILQQEIALDPKETTVTLEEKAAPLGGEMLVQTIKMIGDGTASETVQDDSKSSYIRQISKEAGIIDWSEGAAAIERKTRAYVPWPGTYTYLEGKLFKVMAANAFADISEADCGAGDMAECAPGEIIWADKKRFIVKTGEGFLEPTEVQIEGKRRMTTEEFMRGYKIAEGQIFG